MIPPIQDFEQIAFDSPFLLVCAAGFEDRAKAIFEVLSQDEDGASVAEGVAIEYLPFKPENDLNLIENGMDSVGVPPSHLTWLTFNTQNPAAFEPDFREYLESTSHDRVLLDISAMSKLLIIQSMQILAEFDIQVTIFYAEAESYKPTETEYETEIEDVSGPDETPAFLTSDIFDILTTPSLSSVAKGGQPLVAIAFPTFNHQEMMALASELSPHLMIMIEGIPRLPQDRWRTEAIRWLNQEAASRIQTQTKQTSTFDYSETYEVLWEIYAEYADAYRLILSPTGSKLQTVAAGLFRRANPDIHVVYPVTKKFPGNYTTGWKNTWGINLGKIDDLIEEERPESEKRLSRLGDRINEIREERSLKE